MWGFLFCLSFPIDLYTYPYSSSTLSWYFVVSSKISVSSLALSFMKLIWLFMVLGFVCGKIFFKRNFILIFYSFWVSFGNLYLLRMYAFHPGCLTYYHELLIFSCNSHFYRVYGDILSFILDFDNFFFFFVILVRFINFWWH